MKSVLKALTLTLGLFTVLVACDQLEGLEPNIVSFKAQPSSISVGETSTLSWTVLGGPEELVVKLSPGDLELAKTGSVKVTPSETTEYTLSAGKSTKSLTVSVGATTDGSDDGSDGGSEDGADDGTDGSDSGSDDGADGSDGGADDGSDGHDSGSDDGADGGDGSDDGSDDGTDGSDDGTDGADEYTQTAKLMASDAAEKALFGSSVAASGSRAVVGAPEAENLGNRTGKVYFFEDDKAWKESYIFEGADLDRNALDVDISGELALVESVCCESRTAAAQLNLFAFSENGWTTDGAFSQESLDTSAISNSTIVARTSGSRLGNYYGPLHVYEIQGGVWTQTARLELDGLIEYDEQEGDELPPEDKSYFGFGGYMDISGDYVVASGPGDNFGGLGYGFDSAYIFERSGDTWGEAIALQPNTGVLDGGEFGNGVAISGQTVAVGGIVSGQKSIFVFERMNGTWTQTALLRRGDGGAYNDSFSIGGTTLVLSATDAADGHDSVDVFERTGSSWQKVQTLESPVDTETDQFGMGIAVLGDTLMIGAPGDDEKGTDSGAVYVYKK